jgi:Cd2+/Zn2+-exporting ATPase
VVEVVPLDGGPAHVGEAALLETAAALEARNEHPLAQAIVEHAAELGLAPAPAEGVRALPGKGAVGRLLSPDGGAPDGDREVWVGSHRYLLERMGPDGVPPEVEERLRQLSATGHSVVVVGESGSDGPRIRGFVALADTLRPDVRGVVEGLHRRGLEHLVVLTGDNEATARAVARDAGIDEVRAELLPEGKVDAVEELVERYRRVAMVGDGVNDAPAMGRSTLGIAMGAAGTDAAIETADVALMADDLGRLPWLIDHSRRALRTIRQNIGFALAVKAIVFLLATVGLASLWAAIAADMGASLLVIANALRLLRG